MEKPDLGEVLYIILSDLHRILKDMENVEPELKQTEKIMERIKE